MNSVTENYPVVKAICKVVYLKGRDFCVFPTIVYCKEIFSQISY